MDYKEIGGKIILALYQQGLTQKELAEKTGINPATINKACNGQKVGNNTLNAMAQELGITLIIQFPQKKD
jgi:transcriptional regulator with XRE-family HTH domain